MERASHLARGDGRVQKPISKGLKESISVPILDATALDPLAGRRTDVGYRIS
jgi:hypothetical protein